MSQIDKIEKSCSIQYAELQKKAIITAVNKGVLILTGGPGTGKTTIIKCILQVFKNMGKKVVIVANLKPVTLCGVESKGMIVAGDTADGDAKVIFPDQSLPCGSKIH
mgnify:CR=1 FL=1